MASKLADNNLRPQFASRFNVKTRVKRQGRWDSREEERKSKKSEVGEGNRNIWEEVTKVETLHCAFDFLTTTVYRHPSYYSSFISIVCLCPNEECARCLFNLVPNSFILSFCLSVLIVRFFQLSNNTGDKERDKRIKKKRRWREKGKAGNESSLTMKNGKTGKQNRKKLKTRRERDIEEPIVA